MVTKDSTGAGGAKTGSATRPSTTKDAGDAGEARALAHLLGQGLALVQRNYRVARGPRARGGEIDLILRERDGTLVFVEVRTRAARAWVGAAASVGLVVNVPLNSRDGQASWSYFYGNISKKFKDANGARLTFGAYGVAANADPKSGPVSFVSPDDGTVGTRGGVLVGYEQPLGKSPVSFVVDWFSGKNNLDYFTPGISVTLPHNGLFNIGYSIGNDSWANSNATKNRFVFAYYGVTF